MGDSRAWLRFVPLVLVLGLAVLIFAMGWNRYLSLDTLREHGGALTALTQRHYLLVLLALFVVFALATASAIPGVVFITLTAGYLFGPWVGGVVTAAAATTGALAIYFVSRTALGQELRRRAESRPGLLRSVCEGVDRNTFQYVLVARLVVTVPFHLINLAAGVVSAPLVPYALATFIGLLPVHIIYGFVGSELSTALATDADIQPGEALTYFAWPLAGVALLAIVLPLAIRLLRRRSGRVDGGDAAV